MIWPTVGRADGSICRSGSSRGRSARWRGRIACRRHRPSDDDRAWRLACDCEARQQLRLDRQPRPAIDPQRIARPRHQKQQADARIGDDVAQRVDAVIAVPVRHHQRLLVVDADKPARSPRGVQSMPSGPLVASATNGELSISTRYCGVMRLATLTVEASFVSP